METALCRRLSKASTPLLLCVCVCVPAAGRSGTVLGCWQKGRNTSNQVSLLDFIILTDTITPFLWLGMLVHRLNTLHSPFAAYASQCSECREYLVQYVQVDNEMLSLPVHLFGAKHRKYCNYVNGTELYFQNLCLCANGFCHSSAYCRYRLKYAWFRALYSTSVLSTSTIDSLGSRISTRWIEKLFRWK